MHGSLLIAIVIAFLCPLIETSEDEYRLIHYLFSEQDYNPLIRPTLYSNETLVVSFGLLLVQIIHVFEKEQVMKSNTWLHMKWYDPQLRWNPQRYGGIDKINIPHSSVWTPDVVLFNNADGNYEVTFKCKVVLMHTGEVHWIPPAIYKSSCRIDVRYFPFDTQECEMRFASWTYNAREVTFSYYTEENDQSAELTKLLPQQVYSASSDELYKDDYLESGTWDVISIPSQFVHYHSNISVVTPDYIEIVFLIKMRRKALYYTVNLIVPTFLMSTLICIVFCLPTAAGEKMTLCMSILLALNLFQLLVTKILPPTSAVVPFIAKYLLFTFSLNVLVIFNTVVIANFYYRTSMTDTMPLWLRHIFLYVLPPLLWLESPKLRDKRLEYEAAHGVDVQRSVIVQDPCRVLMEATVHHQQRRSKSKEKNRPLGNESDASLRSYFNNKRRTSTLLAQHTARSTRPCREKDISMFVLNHAQPSLLTTDTAHRRIQIEVMRRELKQALAHVRFIASHCARKASLESIRDEWKFIATVIDRLQFVVFSLITVFGSLALLFQVSVDKKSWLVNDTRAVQVSHMFHTDPENSKKLVRFSNPNTTIHKLIGTIEE